MEKLEPIVYTADEIGALLGMKKSTGYTFIKEVYEKRNAFPVYKICGQYRVPKKAFHIWLEGAYEENGDEHMNLGGVRITVLLLLNTLLKRCFADRIIIQSF